MALFFPNGKIILLTIILRKTVKGDQQLPLSLSRIRGAHVGRGLTQFGSLKAVSVLYFWLYERAGKQPSSLASASVPTSR